MPKAKKKKVTKKEQKKRANKYQEKLKINGSFQDLLKELATPKELANSAK